MKKKTSTHEAAPEAPARFEIASVTEQTAQTDLFTALGLVPLTDDERVAIIERAAAYDAHLPKFTGKPAPQITIADWSAQVNDISAGLE